jgi:tryptophan synthase alpha chain
VFLAAPSSTDERIASIAPACRGFVYAASLMGITGTRSAVSGEAPGLVKRIREHCDVPVAVGLGVSNGAQAAQVAAFADGVIVGSAFVRALLDAADAHAADQGIPAVSELTAELCAGVRRLTR